MRVVMEASQGQEDLLRRAQEGEREAFETLLRDSWPEIEKYARTRVGDHLRSRVDVEDVLQETCTRAWEAIAGLHWTGDDTFARWLKGIARHVILRQVDQERRDDLIYLRGESGSRDPSPSRALRRAERFDRLREALQALPPDYRQAILLVRLDGLRVKEAAMRMQRTPKAVTHLLARGLRMLKQGFGDTESLGLPAERLKGGEAGDA